jgi:hypothetical protein
LSVSSPISFVLEGFIFLSLFYVKKEKKNTSHPTISVLDLFVIPRRHCRRPITTFPHKPRLVALTTRYTLFHRPGPIPCSIRRVPSIAPAVDGSRSVLGKPGWPDPCPERHCEKLRKEARGDAPRNAPPQFDPIFTKYLTVAFVSFCLALQHAARSAEHDPRLQFQNSPKHMQFTAASSARLVMPLGRSVAALSVSSVVVQHCDFLVVVCSFMT